MPKKLNQSLFILAGFILFLAASQAEELTANAGVTSNYVFRGLTQTDDGFAVQGGIDWVHESNLYLGAWASNVEDTATSNDGFEIDLYAGFTFDLGNDRAIDIGYIAYEYTDNAFTDVQEVFIGFTFKQLSVTYYDGDRDNNGIDYYYLDVKYLLELQNEVKLGFHYGHQGENAGSDADDISVSLSKEFQDLNVSLTFSSYDASGSAADKDEIFVTVTRTFDL